MLLHVVELVDDGSDATGEVVHPVSQLIASRQRGAVLGEGCSFLVEFALSTGDLVGAPLHIGEFDEAALVEVDESSAFGGRGVEFAVEPGEFGGE